ncbi:MAG: SMP-30/gluconolactonase/LRE family protein, partial [Proteobacteria bacterium]|nr:SMP-30/gluconolactonase/LRE family protein [Pseudomonadota bacterium]
VDRQGFIYTGNADGIIQKLSRKGEVETFAVTGGHPLGLDFDATGNLIVCEPYSGLLMVSPKGVVSNLVHSYQGEEFGLLDDVKVAHDGRIYFTDASWKYHLDEYQLDVLEARPNGRLFRYDPKTAQLELLMDQLYFANGVALSAAEDFLIVAETSRYRLSRLWLQGPRAGQREVFLDNLPGMPDTISSNHEGIIWVAYFSVRDALLDALHPYPWIKSILARVPLKMLPKPKAYSFVVAYDERAQVLQNYQDPSGKTLGNVTSVEEYRGELYMGSLLGDAIGVIALPRGLSKDHVKVPGDF